MVNKTPQLFASASYASLASQATLTEEVAEVADEGREGGIAQENWCKPKQHSPRSLSDSYSHTITPRIPKLLRSNSALVSSSSLHARDFLSSGNICEKLESKSTTPQNLLEEKECTATVIDLGKERGHKKHCCLNEA